MANIKDLFIKLRLIGGKKTKDDLKGVDKGLKSVGKSALKVGASFFAARGLITGLTRSIELAGRFEKVERGFSNLAKASGFSSQSLGKLQKATDGTMSSMQLMTQANNAMLLGIVDSEDQMAELFDISQRLASSLGKDTTFGIESMVTGLGRQSKLMLDNLGIMVDTNKAYKDYAENLGVTVSQLSDQQKKQAFVNAAMSQANTLVNKLGAETLTSADHINRMKAALEESAIELGTTFSAAVETAADSLVRFLKFTQGAVKEIKFLTLPKETREFVKQMAIDARTVIEEGNIDIIQQQIAAISNILEKFPRTGEILSPVLAELQKTAQSLKETTQGADNIANTISLSAKASENLAKFTAQTSTSLIVSAAMGDSVADAFKRALFQQVLITAQLKIQEAIQEKMAAMQVVAGGPGSWLMSAANFLFGASPTQTAPSAGMAASASRITINQNFGGMGVIDHNFAANNIIPAINKAISTGQARIG